MALEPSKISEARPAAIGRETSPVPPPAKPVLLIIDDDEAVRSSIRVIFNSEFEVLVAGSGPAAMELLRTRAVDVATLDLNLPGMSGIDVLGQLKEHDPLMEVIIMTGQGSLETARQAIQLGAFAYLTKPFQIQECRRVMCAALERHHRMAGLRALELEMQRRQVEQEIERAKSEIYATVIHDLNSPLTTALGLLELLRLDLSMLPGSQPLDVAYVEQQLRDAGHQLKFCTDIIKR
jgi:CheY-like chemotaxis protein